MKHRARLSFTLVSCLACIPLAAQDAADALSAKLDEQFHAAYPDDEPGAAVIITQAGKTIFRKGYGMASMELGVRVDPDHVFCLASVTKPFTSMAVLALVEAGELALTDKAVQYLPELELDDRITVEHLLSHSAGIPDFTTQEAFDHSHIHAGIEPAELCEAARGQELLFDPGTQFRYSNLHYALLARIVEVASEKSWEAFVDERVCKPAGMEHTMYGGHDRIIPNAVTGYEPDGDGWKRARAVSYTRGYGLGGLFSSVDDLAKWNQAYGAGVILKPETIARMQTPPVLADGKASTYALGWMVRDVRGHRIVFHAGGIYGWRAMLVRIPENEVFVAVLTNRDDDANPLAKLAVGAAALVASKQ